MRHGLCFVIDDCRGDGALLQHYKFASESDADWTIC